MNINYFIKISLRVLILIIASLSASSTNAAYIVPDKRCNDNSLNYGCSNPLNFNHFKDKCDTKVVLHVTQNQTLDWAGARVESIRVPVPASTTEDLTVQIWIAEESHDAPPVISESLHLPVGSHIGALYDIFFDNPYTIKPGVDFYVGYTLMTPSGYSDIYLWYSYPSDYAPTKELASNILIFSSLEYVSHFNPYGFDYYYKIEYTDVCKWSNAYDFLKDRTPYIRISISGCSIQKDRIEFTEAVQIPQIKPGDSINLYLNLRNAGFTDIRSAEFQMTVGASEPKLLEWNSNKTLQHKQSSGFSVTTNCDQIGIDIPICINVTSVNGHPVEPYNAYTGYVTSIENGYSGNLILESYKMDMYKYVGLKRMMEKDNPAVFPVVLSTLETGARLFNTKNIPLSDLEHGWPLFADVLNDNLAFYCNQWFLSRIESDSGNLENMYHLDELYESWQERKTCAVINAVINKIPGEDKKVEILTNTKFYHDFENHTYGIGYIIVEDTHYGVIKNPFYTLRPDSEYAGYGKTYNPILSIARKGSYPEGIPSTLPESIRASEIYETRLIVDLSDVDNLTRYRILPLVVRMGSKEIVNSCNVYSPEYVNIGNPLHDDSSIPRVVKDGIVISSGLSASVYSPNGIICGNTDNGGLIKVPAGIYIVACNGKSFKVVVQ